MFSRVGIGLIAAGLLVGTLACGSGDDSGGTFETIGLGDDTDLELFVPDGWFFGRLEVPETVAAEIASDLYFLADRDRVPEDLPESAESDPDASDELTAPARQGAALPLSLMPAAPCQTSDQIIDEYFGDLLDDSDVQVKTEELVSSIGEGGIIITATEGEDSVTSFVTSLALPSGSCRTMTMFRRGSVTDQGGVETTIRQIAERSALR